MKDVTVWCTGRFPPADSPNRGMTGLSKDITGKRLMSIAFVEQGWRGKLQNRKSLPDSDLRTPSRRQQAFCPAHTWHARACEPHGTSPATRRHLAADPMVQCPRTRRYVPTPSVPGGFRFRIFGGGRLLDGMHWPAAGKQCHTMWKTRGSGAHSRNVASPGHAQSLPKTPWIANISIVSPEFPRILYVPGIPGIPPRPSSTTISLRELPQSVRLKSLVISRLPGSIVICNCESTL